MVFLVLTRAGYDQLVSSTDISGATLWVNDDVLTRSELEALRKKGVNVTNFTNHVVPGTDDVARAVGTIEEHHPGQRVWIEHVSDL